MTCVSSNKHPPPISTTRRSSDLEPPLRRHHGGARHFAAGVGGPGDCGEDQGRGVETDLRRDRKSTRLNSSHGSISYAVFCLKKKKNTQYTIMHRVINLS